jgi:hypothetical protein
VKAWATLPIRLNHPHPPAATAGGNKRPFAALVLCSIRYLLPAVDDNHDGDAPSYHVKLDEKGKPLFLNQWLELKSWVIAAVSGFSVVRY